MQTTTQYRSADDWTVIADGYAFTVDVGSLAITPDPVLKTRDGYPMELNYSEGLGWLVAVDTTTTTKGH